MTALMKAVVLEQTGGPDNLVYRDVPLPVITDPHHVLVKIKACGSCDDCVGSATLGSVLKSLVRIGRVAVIGTISPQPLSLKLGALVVNGLTVKGSDGTTRQAIRESMTLVAAGKINIRIDRTLPLEKAAEAHRRLEDRQAVGRIVLLP